MSDRVCIGTRFTDGYLIFLGAGAAASAGFAVLITGTPKGNAPYFWGAAAGLLLGFLFRLWHVSRNRRWITPADDGFVLEDCRGKVHFSNEQVDGLAYRTTVRYQSGLAKASVTRGSLTIQAEGIANPIDFRYEFPLERPDPLAQIFDRVLTRLTDRAKSGDAPLTGRGWEYDLSGLSIGSAAGRRVVAPEDITAVDLVEGKVCVWARGDTLPSLRVLARSPNALVLARLLGRELQGRPPADDDSGAGLGRLLFERGKSTSPLTILGITAAVGIPFVALFAYGGGLRGVAFGVGFLAVVGSPLLLVALLTRTNVFRCHARGVSHRTSWRTTELSYEEVESFTYSGVRQYINCVYTGTTFEIKFRPRRSIGRPIAFKGTVQGGDEELDNLREQISRVIAFHMLRRLQSGKGVRWTPEVKFRRDGLELTVGGGLFRRSQTWTLPYDRIAGMNLNEGHFFLFEYDREKPVYQSPVSVENFFPGYELLRQLLASPELWEGWADPLQGGEEYSRPSTVPGDSFTLDRPTPPATRRA